MPASFAHEHYSEVLKKAASLLAKQNVKVTQHGARAYIQWNSRTFDIERINVPVLPRDADEKMRDVIVGYLDHEVAHALYTKPREQRQVENDYVKKSGRPAILVRSLSNIIEDVRIEACMERDFKGSLRYLDMTRAFFLESSSLPTINKALDDNDIETARSYAAVPFFRARGGQAVCAQFMDDHKLWHLCEAFDRFFPDLEDRLDALTSSADAARLACEIIDKLPQETADDEHDDGDDESDDNTGDKGGSDKKNQPQDQDESQDDEQDEEKSDDCSGDGEGEGDSEDEDDAEGGQGSSGEDEDDAEDEGDDNADGEDEGEDSGKGDGNTSAEGEEDGNDENEGDAGTSDDSGDEGDESSGQDGDKSGDTVSGGADEDGSGGGGPDDLQEADLSNPNTNDDTEEDGDEPKAEDLCMNEEAMEDFDESMADLIEEAVGTTGTADEYRVFSYDYDFLGLAEAPPHAPVESYEKRVQKTSSALRKNIERLIAARSLRVNVPGKRRGRIHAPSLHRLRTDDDRVFSTRHETPSKNTAVSLGVDLSGSMAGKKMTTAIESAWAFSEVLTKINVPNEVIGFTTGRIWGVPPGVSEAEYIRFSQLVAPALVRPETLHMPIFKTFDEGFGVEQKRRLAGYAGNGVSGANIDGESIRVIARRLHQRREERKILMVFSDGRPASQVGSPVVYDLSRAVDEITKAGIETCGIGINDRTVSKYYSRSFVIQDLEQLGTTMLGELKRILLG